MSVYYPMNLEKIVSLGNSTGQGAKLALRERKEAPRLHQIVERTEYVELSFIKSFPREFIKYVQFPISCDKG